jgi:hypothetical protein
MNLNNINEEGVIFILKGLESLIRNGELTMEDILKASALHQMIDKLAREIIDKTDNEALPETLTRGPNTGEKFIYGREKYVK